MGSITKISTNRNLKGILDKIMNVFHDNNYISLENFKEQYKKEEINNIAADLIIKKANKGNLDYIKSFYNIIIPSI